jgi:hypothetical protein
MNLQNCGRLDGEEVMKKNYGREIEGRIIVVEVVSS